MAVNQEKQYSSADLSIKTSNLVGYYSAISTAILTCVTFGFAITALPISGANCVEGCIEYPYLDTLAQYPKDYRWMFLAMFMILSYLILMTSIHFHAAQEKKMFSQMGWTFSMMAALILWVDYFVQFSVIPISLFSGEMEGIALWTQYNPHGIFIALEELGYLLMSLSFLCMAPVFVDKNRAAGAVRWIFIIGFILAVLSFIWIAIQYGLDRQYRFEIVIISITWLVLIVNGILLANIFRRQWKAKSESGNGK